MEAGSAVLLAPPRPRELGLLLVADEAQGRGGRQLVAHMQSEARAAGLDRLKVVHFSAEGFSHGVGAVRTGTACANPPVVPWDRPELVSARHATESFRDFPDLLEHEVESGLAVHVICDNLFAQCACS